ncbi:MAG: RluA family pseudouridine synthase [Syntrophobacterales bacterium]|nr:RluA family pseudouridine synthase [Syntrophobacterales bacterium]
MNGVGNIDLIQDFVEELRSGKAIIYEDGNLITISKPSGIPSIPERRPTGNDLLSILSRERGEKFYVVHRLDKDVSGIILFAKDKETHRIMNRFFELRLIEKTYIALVHGIVKDREISVEAPLRRFGSGRVGVDYRKGKPSITHLRVIKRFSSSSLLTVFPRTGRSHQIRAHLYHIGHPIVGDQLYGDPSKKALVAHLEGPVLIVPRLMLHALSLKIPPTGSNRPMFFKAALPKIFRHILKVVENLELECGI